MELFIWATMCGERPQRKKVFPRLLICSDTIWKCKSQLLRLFWSGEQLPVCRVSSLDGHLIAGVSAAAVVVLSSPAAFVLQTVSSVEVVASPANVISSATAVTDALHWCGNEGRQSRQVAPSSILEGHGGRRREGKGRGCSFILAQVWKASVCVFGQKRKNTLGAPAPLLPSPTVRMDGAITGGFNPWLRDWTIMV